MEVLRDLRPRRALTMPARPWLPDRGCRLRYAVVMGAVFAASLLGAPAASAQLAPGRAGTATAPERWPVRSREHLDLWLHGFALISDDSSLVPLFDRAYRPAATKAKNEAKVFSELDANLEPLAKRLKDNPSLLNAQFLPLYFASWGELEEALDLFLRAEGNPRNARSDQAAATVALVAASFPAKDDRDFARRFLAGLRSERDLFFHRWWLDETKRRDATFERVDSLWQKVHRPKLQTFLNNTKLGAGELILALALDAEGRTVTEGKQLNRVAVGFPDSPERAEDAIFAFAHEVVSSLTAAAVDDNTTPAEKRSGAAARLAGVANVRGGALLMTRLAPDLDKRYAAYYLRAAGVAAGDDVLATFARTFPLPTGMLESIDRQIAIALSGI